MREYFLSVLLIQCPPNNKDGAIYGMKLKIGLNSLYISDSNFYNNTSNTVSRISVI